ncbi:MAG: hypothetical protein KF852_03520 [Saprospiraceae bacterium]|nr:hypothetical protein [Saprospiraceae bacterium]
MTRKIRKRILVALALLLFIPAVLFLAGAAIIYYHQDELIQKVITEVNEGIEGAMTIEEVRIAPFKNFPYVSIDLRKVNFYETKDTGARPLYNFSDVYIGFDIKQLMAGHYDIKSISVENGHLDIIRRADGVYNILAAKRLKDAAETDTVETPIHLDLQRLKIKQVDIAFIDEAADREMDLMIDNLNARIKYKQKHFYIDLVSDQHLDVLAHGKPTFFAHKAIHLDMELDFDELTHLLRVMPSKASLNDAHFKVEGSVDIDNDMDIALQVRGDKPGFGIFSAFLPEDIAEGLSRYRNAGKIFFEGKVEGRAVNGHIPAVTVEFGCEDAWFLNKKAKKRVDDLRFTGSFTNGEERTLRSSVLQLRNFYAKPEEGVFQGHLFIKNFEDPIVKLDLHADLDLEFLGKFFQLRELNEVSGKVLLDMKFDEIIDLSFPGESLARLKTGIDSELTIRNVQFKAPQFGHTISNLNGHAVMREGAVVLDSVGLRIGRSDIHVSGTLSDFPALFHRYDKPIRIELLARADRLDLPDLLAFDTALVRQYDEIVENLSVQVAFETQAKELFDFKHLPRGEFFIDDLYARLKHYPHTLHDFHADVIITDKDLLLKDFSGEVDSTDFHFSGTLGNYPKWFQEEPLGDSHIEFDLVSNYLKIHDLLSYKGENYVPEEYRDEVFRNTKLHGRADLHYNKGFQSVDLYLDELTSQTLLHPLKLERFKGRAHYENDHLLLEEFSGKMGQSDFKVNMSYFFGEQKSKQTRNNYLVLQSNVLDLDALSGYKGPQEQTDHAAAFNIFELPFPNMALTAEIGRMNYHRYWLEDMSIQLRLQDNHYLYVDTLALRLAGGNMQMKGYFNGSDSNNIYYYSDINAQNLDIDKLLLKFDNFGQDVLINENLHGRITGKIKSTFKMHPDLTPIIEKSEAHMELLVTDGSLVDFAPVMAMSDYFKDKNLRILRFNTLQNVLDLKDGALTIPGMFINSSIGFMEVSGRQHLDMSMAYFVRVPLKMVTQVAFRKLFGGKNKEEVDPDQIDEIDTVGDLNKVRFLNIRITGTPDDYKIGLGKEKKEKEKKEKKSDN